MICYVICSFQILYDQMSNVERKKQKLQMMSDLATMRFQLKDSKLYLSEKNVKKSQFVRFGKSQPKHANLTPVKQAKQTSTSNLLVKRALSTSKSKDKEQQDKYEEEEERVYGLKFLDKLSDENILVGNQYQLDMLKIGAIIDNFIDVEYKWSIEPSQPISSVSVDTKYGIIAMSRRKTVQFLKYNLKRDQLPKTMAKSIHDQDIQQIRFVRNMSIFVILQTKIQFHTINIVYQKAEINKCFIHKFNYGPNFKLYYVPHSIENSLNLYFYQNKVKPQQAAKFGLWVQLIQAKTSNNALSVGKLTLVCNINLRDRKQFRIYNFSKEFCLIKFQFNLIAVKNGYIIDQITTNFHKQNSFIQYIQSNKSLIHYRKGYIDIYKLSMNMIKKPETIQLQCVDSFEFQSPKNTKFFKIMQIYPQCYSLFYEGSPKNLSKKPQIQYMFCISHEVELKKKIDKMYPKQILIQNIPLEQLQDKCNQAQKFGMSNKEAFYELWSRSNKSSDNDYKILLSTKDFQTVTQQIEKKLKKQSMSIREVIKIYTSCLQMLRQNILSSQCTVTSLIQYSSCHFLLKKLELYRYFMNEKRKDQQNCNDQEAMKISIKDYYQYSDMSILNELIELMGQYLQKKSKPIITKIKTILQYFKLIFRINYMDTIDKIINTCKLRILQILQLIPQLLPYHYHNNNKGIGLWDPVTELQKSDNIFLNQLITIDNKDKVEQFSKNIWFKRNINTNHGVITIDRQNIIYFIQKENNYEQIFYKFLFRIYNLRIYDQNLRKLIIHIQKNYALLPLHLKGKFQLYIILYQMFQNFNQQYKLEKFLKFRQFQLFKMYFQRQKIQKQGFILKKIRPLYEKVVENGKQVFNQGIYNYFSLGQSSVADLKTILNKLNNQKNEFHIASQKLYQVLIQAIMKKIKIGSEKDTPIDQILVYIQNIPFPFHNDSIMTNLQYIQQINYQSQILRKIKVNMTLQQIVDHPKKVIQLMVQYEINRHDIHKIKDYRSLKIHAYKILAQIQCRKCNIFGDQQPQHSLKTFLIGVMENKQMILLCSRLLKDQYLIEQFGITVPFIEEVVIFLYHWKLKNVKEDRDIYFISHKQYLQTLANLLIQGNSTRQYIQYSIKYAELLSFQDGFKIQYPLFSHQFGYPTLQDFSITLNQLKSKQMVNIDLKALFYTIMQLKLLKDSQLSETYQLSIYKKVLNIQIYQHLIISLIQKRQLRAALQNTFTLLTLPNDYPEFNIIYPTLIIEKLLPQSLQKTIDLFIKLISYYYDSPYELAKVIQQIFNQSFSNEQLDIFLIKKLKKFETKLLINYDNQIIQMKFKQNRKQGWQNIKINKIVQNTFIRIKAANEIFAKNYDLHIIFRFMCYNPLVVSKWIWSKKKGINVKTLRCLISFMSLQNIFDAEAVLLQAKTIFQIILYKCTHDIFFAQLLKWRDKLLGTDQQYIQMYAPAEQDNRAIHILKQSILSIHKKLEMLRTLHREIISQRQKTNYQLFVDNPDKYMELPRSQYIYQDKDDGYEKNNDQLFIQDGRSVGVKIKNQASYTKKSHQQDKLSKRMDQIIVPGRDKRQRKFSQYFPSMINKQMFLNKPLNSSNSQKALFGQKEQKVSEVMNNLMNNEITESPLQNMQSQIFINIAQPKILNKKKKLVKRSGVSEQIIDPMTQLNGIKDDEQKYQFMDINFSKRVSVQSNILYNSESEIAVSQQSEPNFMINIMLDNLKHVPVKQLMEDLLQTITDSQGCFDLTKLKIQSRKQNFLDYLINLMQQIYTNNDVQFEKRLKLILSIAHIQQFDYFSKQCINLFQRLAKLKSLQYLPFKVTETLSVTLLFQVNISQAFYLFLTKILPKIDSINIFQYIKFIEDIFCKKQYKDILLTQFIVQKLKSSFEGVKRHQKANIKNIVLTLFEYYDKCEQSIRKCCQLLLNGDPISQRAAQTLQQLLEQHIKQKA